MLVGFLPSLVFGWAGSRIVARAGYRVAGWIVGVLAGIALTVGVTVALVPIEDVDVGRWMIAMVFGAGLGAFGGARS